MTDATQPAPEAEADGPSAADIADIFGLDDFSPQPDLNPEGAQSPSGPSVGADGTNGAEGAAPAVSPSAPAGSPADTSAAQPASQEPGQPTIAAPPTPPTAEQLELADLKAKLALLEAAPKPAPATEAAPAAPAQEQEQPAKARFPILQLPNEIKEGLISDDPELMTGAVSALLSGVANTIYATVLKDLEPKFKALDDGIKAPIAAKAEEDELAQAAEAAKTQRENYFKAFPQHNDPKLMPIIQSELQALVTQHPNLTFDEPFIAALGTRVNAYLASLGVPVQDQQQQAPATQQPQRPPATIPAGTRTSDEPSLTDEITDLMTFD